MLVSFALALVVGACWIAAFAAVVLSPLLHGDVGPLAGAALFVVRWGVAGAILLLTVGLLLHFAPERDQPLGWVTFGTTATITATCSPLASSLRDRDRLAPVAPGVGERRARLASRQRRR